MDPLRFRFADDADVLSIVALVESAYRGEDSRAGWTTEADLLEGQRVDPEGVREALGNPLIRILLAERGAELVACCELHRPPRDRDDVETEVVPVRVPVGSDEDSDVGGEAAEPSIVETNVVVAHGCVPDVMAEGVSYFGMFAVRPGLQGGGVGREFLTEAERIAREDWHASELQMTVIHLRTELIEWYERRGYGRTGRQKPFPYGDERFGIPARDDLHLEVLSKPLKTEGSATSD